MATATLTQTSSSSKKRKQPPTEADASYENAGPSVHKKSKKDKKHKKSKHSGEHKSKQSKSVKSIVDDRREFNVLQASLVVSLAPVFSANPHAGVEEMLDSMVMRYVPAFKGVVLTHSNLHFLQSNGTIQGDCPYVSCHVTFDATVWNPVVGMQLSARVNLCSPDHIALLIHETFNVSIPKHHIPLDEWEFQYGPAENDPLYGSGSGVEALSLEEDQEKMDVDVDVEPTLSKPEEAEKETEAPESMGDWVRRASGDPIGGKDRKLTFTVVGLTIANEMLSLVGSIQPDPFSPDHVPDPADIAATAAAAAKSARAGSVISEDSDAEWANVPPPAAVPSEDDDDDDDDGEDDEFDPADAMAILQKLREKADKDKANKVKAAKVASAPAPAPPAAVVVGEGNGDKAEKKKRKKEKSKSKADAPANSSVVAEKKKKEKKQEKFKSKEMIDDDEDDKD